MEKRLTLAFVLSLATLLLWGYLNPAPKKPQEQTPQTSEKDGNSSGESGKSTDAGTKSSTPKPTKEKAPEALPAGVTLLQAADSQRVTLENSLLRLHFSNRGGVLERAELKDFHPAG